MKSYVSFLLSFALICSSLPVSGQTGNQPQQQSGSVRVGTVEVSLDVVVRDKKGRPVKDLSAADFEVYEDGVRQQVESFRLVSRESGTSDKTTTSNETKTGTVV
ncbi:MAG TPA: hypothetical protein VEF04_09825, partial [Blastocatellia bacterium]|nr:hypothetical protein [Blastocatellia bacterium]